ncbi:hypothetical protein [Sphingobacterium thalpophilum]|uniref:Uncharacterized protein n=1 Tax=Sphingobacterium thalpophilum TaxID=259 RepID=A0A4U9VLC8_9SPHI|nr:hypothetical protein [Sphingobacterium thalpophilum]VTR47990.1 Uncharacterised protein [Sphingobacterium thalpophilum]
MKAEIIDNLSTLIAYNVRGSVQYKHRFDGFVGELDFKEFMTLRKPDNIFLDGGMFVPIKQKTSYLENPVYFTVTSQPIENYRDVYSRFSNVSCKALYILCWNADTSHTWDRKDILNIGKSILVPTFIVYKFKDGDFISSSLDELLAEFRKTYHSYKDEVNSCIKQHFADTLMRFDETHLKELYLQRLVFDGYIGLQYERGKPTDIDQIVLSGKTDDYYLLEVKEKDLCKREPKGFGMDIERIGFFGDLKRQIGMETYYFIKQIKDQRTREFLQWRYITMTDFFKYCLKENVEGGIGMRSENSKNYTWICPENHFKVYP